MPFDYLAILNIFISYLSRLIDAYCDNVLIISLQKDQKSYVFKS